MSSSDPLLSLDEARLRMLAAVHPLGAETVPIGAALGRVLAEDIVAAHDQPPFDASAMDGYAVRREDAADVTATLTVIGEVPAGATGPRLSRGTAIRIFTGAPMPEGADMVVPQERVTVAPDGRISLGPLAGSGDNLRRQGGDFVAGRLLLGAGGQLDPWRLSLLASAGRSHVSLYKKPHVAVMTTGNELTPPGSDRGPSQIFESNGHAAAALVRWWGGDVAAKISVDDDPGAMRQAVENQPSDLVVTIGGASVGRYDLVKPALADLGLRLVFERIRMRPGKPSWFGILANGTPVLGLPGNPSAALVAAQLLLKPLMMRLQGADLVFSYDRARLTATIRGGRGWERFERARLSSSEDGTLLVQPFTDQDSGRVRVFAAAAALIRIPVDCEEVTAGSVVDILRLDRLGLDRLGLETADR